MISLYLRFSIDRGDDPTSAIATITSTITIWASSSCSHLLETQLSVQVMENDPSALMRSDPLQSRALGGSNSQVNQ